MFTANTSIIITEYSVNPCLRNGAGVITAASDCTHTTAPAKAIVVSLLAFLSTKDFSPCIIIRLTLYTENVYTTKFMNANKRTDVPLVFSPPPTENLLLKRHSTSITAVSSASVLKRDL